MADSFFNSFLDGILGSHATRVDLDSDTIKMYLHDAGAGGAMNASTQDFYNDVQAGLVGTAYTLANKVIGSPAVGVFDNTVDPAPAFTSVTGASCEALVLYKDTGTPTTSDLICWFDITLTPNGGDVNVTFNASGIFKV